jgi:diguanylate cyclase (GGDEF)-like protein
MSFYPQTVIYSFLLSFCLAFLFFSWPRKQMPGVRFLISHQLFLAFWLICLIGESLSYSAATKILWSQICYLGFPLAIPFFVLFVIEYSTQTKINSTFIMLILVIPILTGLVAVTNPWHHLIWKNVYWGSISLNLLVYEHGIVYDGYVIYCVFLSLFGFGVLFHRFQRSQSPFRSQLLLLALSGIFPLITSLLYATDVLPVMGLDYSTFGFLITYLFLSIGLSNYRLLDLVPVDISNLIKQFQDGMIIIDTQERVVEINQRALELLKITEFPIIGLKVQSIVPWKIEFERTNHLARTYDVCFDEERGTFYQVQVSNLTNKGLTHVGFLVVLRDISLSKQTQIQLKLANERLQNQVTEISSLKELLQDQATHDSLTNLHNRRLMDEVLNQFSIKSRDNNQPLSILVMDVDHFKLINDDHGHQAGDEILVAVGNIIKTLTRSTDFCCRFGGDEILVALQNMTSDLAAKKAEEIRREIEQLNVEIDGRLICVKTSIGVATFPQDADSVDELIYAADQAMYQAKANGGNQVKLASIRSRQ